MTAIRTFLTAVVGIGIAAAASAQTDKMAPSGRGEATIYRDIDFQGPAVYIGEAKPNLGLNWPVRSIRVRSGLWELCSRTRYRGRCTKVSADERDIRGQTGFLDMVQSMRPLGGPQIQPPVQPEPPVGPSLRGMGAAFFPAPGRYNARILSCPNGNSTTNCAASTADEFCRSAGWNGSAYESQETVNRRIYLADVLCVRSGF